MDNLKKVGLTALAGSLVAFSAHAGEMSVAGGAKISYTADTGNEDIAHDGNRFGLQKNISATGTGELDNGHTVTMMQSFATTGSLSTTVLTYDMGDMGKLVYQEDSGDLGIGKIDDLMPSADEEVTNGISTEATSGGDLNGKVDGGQNGFNYTYVMDTVTINAGYAPKTMSGNNDDGANQGAGALNSSMSIALQASVMDGLSVFAGTGEKGTATSEDDHDTYGLTYAYGPVTVGYQHSEIDFGGTTADQESDYVGISFAVNDNLSISYGEQETSATGGSVDQEVDGFSVGYSMGGISLAAHANEATGIAQTASNESKHTEIAISFAF